MTIRVLDSIRAQAAIFTATGRASSPIGGLCAVTHRRSLHRTWCDVASLPVLRRWLRTNMPSGIDAADAELVCTELVTNAIEHGGGARAVRITVDCRQVCVAVDDDEADVLPIRGTSRLGRYRGRGIVVVNALAVWGIAGAARGKTVWARVKFAS